MKLKITEIKPNPANPRLIKDDKFKRLVQSLKDFPEMLEARPIILNKDRMILGGNMRLKAAIQAGYKEVDAEIFDWPEDKQREFIIKDNISGGEWDWDLLANEWDVGQLDEWGLDLPGDFGNQEIEEDEAPGVSQDPPQSVFGAVYQLGRHKVMCGDAFKDTEMLMDGLLATMVFTDPPYNTGMSAKTNAGSTRLNHMFEDSYTAEEWDEFLSNLTSTLSNSTKGDAAIYICFAWKRNHELMPHLLDHFTVSNIIVWDKMVHGLGSDYQYTYELINVCKKGKPKLNTHQGDAEYQDVWHIQRKVGRNDDHATAKPIILCARAINHASKTDDIILDCFLGSGSTLIACEQTDRTCFGMELDPKYVDVIRKRYAKLIDPEGWETKWQEMTPVLQS